MTGGLQSQLEIMAPAHLPRLPRRQLFVARCTWIAQHKAVTRQACRGRQLRTSCHATCSTSAENAEAQNGAPAARPIQMAPRRMQWHQLPGVPKGFRCCLCYETDFATRSQLAEHLVSQFGQHPSALLSFCVVSDGSSIPHSQIWSEY